MHRKLPAVGTSLAFLSIAIVAMSPVRAADQATLAVLPPTSTAVTYALHEDVMGPGGTSRTDEHVALAMIGDAHYEVTIASADGQQKIAVSEAAGALTSSSPNSDSTSSTSALQELNLLLPLEHSLPIENDATWNRSASVTMPGGDTVTVPLTISVKSVHGSEIVLTATGNGNGTIHGKGHSASARVDVTIDATFHGGRIVTATTTQTTTAHVIFHTLTFGSTWTLSSS